MLEFNLLIKQLIIILFNYMQINSCILVYICKHFTEVKCFAIYGIFKGEKFGTDDILVMKAINSIVSSYGLIYRFNKGYVLDLEVIYV